MTDTYELPWTAAITQRQLVTEVIIDDICAEMINEGFCLPMERFLEEYTDVPAQYTEHVRRHFGEEVPAEVQGIIRSISERITDMSAWFPTYDKRQLPLVERNAFVAKMAVTIAEVRALNDVLGF